MKKRPPTRTARGEGALLLLCYCGGGGKKKERCTHFGNVGRLEVSGVLLLLFLLDGLGAGALEVGSCERGAALVKCEGRRTQLLPGWMM